MGLSAVLLIFNNWPQGRITSIVENLDSGFIVADGNVAARIPAGQDGVVALPATYSLTLDEPAGWRYGAENHLRLIVEESGQNSALSPFVGWRVTAESSMQSAQISFRPEGSIYQRLGPDTPAEFRWYLKGRSENYEPGTLWLYLHFTPPRGGDPVRVLALARQISIQSTALFGMPANVLNLSGWAGLSVGALIAVSGILQNRKSHPLS